MKRVAPVLAALVVLCTLAALWAAREYRREEAMLHQPMPIAEATEYRIAPGSSLSRVAKDLAGRSWLASPRFFAWYVRDRDHAIKAGTYALVPGMSPLDALALFVEGREVQYPFTIVEGWTFAELMAALAASPHLEQTLQGLGPEQIMARLDRPQRHPEGMFLADTYLFPPGTTDLAALRRALAALEQALERAWSARAADLPLAEPYHALVLASIIEKETADAAERPRIAGVFVERLRRDMLLQTDPTVIYGLGAEFDGDLRRRDLRADTPYNTYTRKGLPPTPIALVGPDALHAAVNPVVDGSLFFVSRGDGSHQFSRTYSEHKRAVEQYQLRRASTPGG